MNPGGCGTRGIKEGDAIRVWNALGEMRITRSISPLIKRGIVAVPKGVWRRNTKNGYTSNAMVPDSLSDLGRRRVLQRRTRSGGKNRRIAESEKLKGVSHPSRFEHGIALRY
jgi:anaerobic selenocysteine-containing dehydrogenase